MVSGEKVVRRFEESGNTMLSRTKASVKRPSCVCHLLGRRLRKKKKSFDNLELHIHSKPHIAVEDKNKI